MRSVREKSGMADVSPGRAVVMSSSRATLPRGQFVMAGGYWSASNLRSASNLLKRSRGSATL